MKWFVFDDLLSYLTEVEGQHLSDGLTDVKFSIRGLSTAGRVRQVLAKSRARLLRQDRFYGFQEC
jgi:hypothetical protein